MAYILSSALRILIIILLLPLLCNSKMISESGADAHYDQNDIDPKLLQLQDVDFPSSTAEELFHQFLDQPHDHLTMAIVARLRPFEGGDDEDDELCPLHLCNHVKALISIPDHPRRFLACLEKRQFCGLCPLGTIFQLEDNRFRCALNSSNESNNGTTTEDGHCAIDALCNFDFSKRRLRIPATTANSNEGISSSSSSSNFILCSERLSFCGSCPRKTAWFDRIAFTCTDRFPQTEVICNDEHEHDGEKAEGSADTDVTIRILPDPLSPCSPLGYVCMPGRRRAVPIRCPDPRMRHNRLRATCALPKRVPECGGTLQPYSSNSTSAVEEIELLQFNVTETGPRGPSGNCVGNCMRKGQLPRNTCIRFCTS